MSQRNRKGAVALVAHSGGPTAVLNASLLGVAEEARGHKQIGALYGAAFGLDGIIRDDLIDLFAQPQSTLEAVGEGIASALGTSRLAAGPAELERALAVMRAHDVRYFFYTGGNGSMGTARAIEKMAWESGYELQVVGIPKTIDNDLAETDHTPGYPTTARFFAAAVRDIGEDNRALAGQVEFVETLGRNTGWIVAATVLARKDPDDAPHLIYLPDWPLPLEKLLDDIAGVHRRLGRCVVAICEGQKDEHGGRFGADPLETSRGTTLAANLGHRLATTVAERLKVRARAEKPGLLGRVSRWERPRLDWEEAKMCGAAAVRAACAGVSGQMVTIVREPGMAGQEARPTYRSTTGLAPFERVALHERPFPAEWRSAAGNDVERGFVDYVLPLTGPLPHYARLEPAPVPRARGRHTSSTSPDRPASS